MAGAENISVITCTRLKGVIEDAEGLRFHSTIPLYAKEKKLGLLNVASTEWQELSEDDLHILHTVGDFLSIAIERARLFEQSAQLGMIEERNRLAREMHDTLAQGLTAIALQIEAIDVSLESRDDLKDIRDLVKKALALTRSNLEDARRSVLDLRAAPLEGQSLVDALATLTDEYNEHFDFDVVYAASETRSLPPYLEVGLYRIAQEALTNVARHAEARHVTLAIRMTPDTVHLSIEDDGCGFDSDLPLEGRYGLVGINERARIMGGEMKLFSSSKEGTRVEVVVPTT
jgi:two-component system NarL family sensor kinase